jgi:hypothetical protein
MGRLLHPSKFCMLELLASYHSELLWVKKTNISTIEEFRSFWALNISLNMVLLEVLVFVTQV